MIKQTQRQTGKGCAAAHAASVDVSADVEPHDSEQGDDTTEHNNQDFIDHEESIHDADSNPCFDEIPKDNPVDEPEPRVYCIVRATVGRLHNNESHAQSGRLVGSNRSHVVDPQAEQDLQCSTKRLHNIPFFFELISILHT